MPAYYKLTNQNYFRIGALVVAILTTFLLLWLLIHLSNKWAMEQGMARDAALRKIGCIPEEVHTYHSVMLGEAPASIWRCDGKLVYDQFANVLVQANEDGNPIYRERLRDIKK